LPVEVYTVLALVWVTLVGLSLWLRKVESDLDRKLNIKSG
jgi:hypothetical protein